MADKNLPENNALQLGTTQKMPRNDGTLIPADLFQQKHRDFLAAATSENTRRTYRSAIRHFHNWGGALAKMECL